MEDIITRCYELFDFSKDEIITDVRYDEHNKQLYIEYEDSDGIITDYIPDLNCAEGQAKLKYILTGEK